MTASLTFCGPTFVVQVSDRRVSRPHTDIPGWWSPVDDQRNKAILYGGHAVVTYCGIGELDSKPTDSWLTAELSKGKDFPDAIRHVADVLPAVIRRQRFQRQVPLAIQAAGWFVDSRTRTVRHAIAVVTNFNPRTLAFLGTNSPEFKWTFDVLGPNEYHLLPGGSFREDALYARTWRTIAEAYKRRRCGPQSIMRIISAAVRELSYDPSSRGSVGPNQMGSMVTLTAAVRSLQPEAPILLGSGKSWGREDAAFWYLNDGFIPVAYGPNVAAPGAYAIDLEAKPYGVDGLVVSIKQDLRQTRGYSFGPTVFQDGGFGLSRPSGRNLPANAQAHVGLGTMTSPDGSMSVGSWFANPAAPEGSG